MESLGDRWPVIPTLNLDDQGEQPGYGDLEAQLPGLAGLALP